jgi:peptidoglycan/LPS O-acetylase OafA/YrhL
MEPVDVEPFRLGQRRWLDGLRGVAVLAVLAFHFGFLPGGSVGVDVFFVLSGFLITSILAEEWGERGSIRLGRFYRRRALRLWPAFAVLLLSFAVRIPFLPNQAEIDNAKKALLVTACSVSNWPSWHHARLGNLGHAWSLAVEEQFYLLWPIALLTMLRLRWPRTRILAIVGIGIVASAVDRYLLFRSLQLQHLERSAGLLRLYMGLDTRADALLIGCLIGLLAAWGHVARLRRFDRALGVLALVATAGLGWLAWNLPLDRRQHYCGFFTLSAALTATVIVRLLTAADAPSTILGRLLGLSPLVWAGRLSYGLYLYHVPVLNGLIADGLLWKDPIRSALAAALTLAAAIASYVVVEQPSLRLRHRLEQRTPAETPFEAPAKSAA